MTSSAILNCRNLVGKLDKYFQQVQTEFNAIKAYRIAYAYSVHDATTLSFSKPFASEKEAMKYACALLKEEHVNKDDIWLSCASDDPHHLTRACLELQVKGEEENVGKIEANKED